MLYLVGIGGKWLIYAKTVVFRKPEFPELEFEGDCRVLPTCVILTLDAKRLLHKRCETSHL